MLVLKLSTDITGYATTLVPTRKPRFDLEHDSTLSWKFWGKMYLWKLVKSHVFLNGFIML